MARLRRWVRLASPSRRLRSRGIVAPAAAQWYSLIPVDESRRAWLAGFFDGEGCVSVYKKGASAGPKIALIQKDRAVLETIRGELGHGSIARYTNGVHSLVFSSRESCLYLIEAIYPYSMVKKEKLALVREFCLTMGPKGGPPLPASVRERRLEIMELLRVRPARA